MLPPLFPSVAPAETARFLSTDFTDLNTCELAEEIVVLSWRLFATIKPTEWCAFARFFTGVAASPSVMSTAEIASFGCESILSLLQFTNALTRWVQTTVEALFGSIFSLTRCSADGSEDREADRDSAVE